MSAAARYGHDVIVRSGREEYARAVADLASYLHHSPPGSIWGAVYLREALDALAVLSGMNREALATVGPTGAPDMTHVEEK